MAEILLALVTTVGPSESTPSPSRLFIQMLGGHVAALRVCELRLHRRPQRPLRPLPPRLRTRFLLRATHPRSPSPHILRWTILANQLIARSTSLPLPPTRVPRCPRFGLSTAHVCHGRSSYFPQ